MAGREAIDWEIERRGERGRGPESANAKATRPSQERTGSLNVECWVCAAPASTFTQRAALFNSSESWLPAFLYMLPCPPAFSCIFTPLHPPRWARMHWHTQPGPPERRSICQLFIFTMHLQMWTLTLVLVCVYVCVLLPPSPSFSLPTVDRQGINCFILNVSHPLPVDWVGEREREREGWITSHSVPWGVSCLPACDLIRSSLSPLRVYFWLHILSLHPPSTFSLCAFNGQVYLTARQTKFLIICTLKACAAHEPVLRRF